MLFSISNLLSHKKPLHLKKFGAKRSIKPSITRIIPPIALQYFAYLSPIEVPVTANAASPNITKSSNIKKKVYNAM